MSAEPRTDDWGRLMASGLPVEQGVLGACLIYPDAIDVVQEDIQTEDFVEPVHRLLYDKLVEARANGRRLDVGLLRAMLGDGAKADLGGLSLGDYIGRLMHEAPIAMAVREHAKVMRDLSDIRRLFSQGDGLRERASRGLAAGSPRDIAIDAIASLDAIVASHLPQHSRRLSVGDASLDAIGKMQRAVNGERTAWGAPYGVAGLDRMTRGMHPGHLTILAARPSMGKSAFGLSSSLAAAKGDHCVLFISLEMSADELAERALSSLSFNPRNPIPYVNIRSGDVSDDQQMRLMEANERLSKLPILIEQQRGLSAAQIVARARSAAAALERAGKRLSVVVVDHLGKVKPSERYAGNRNTELGEITGALKDLAGELNVSVVALCQLNRQTESRENKRPTLGDLRESGRIEEDADNVLLLYREGYYLERTRSAGEDSEDRAARIATVEHSMEIIVAKQRQGETGVVDAWVSMPCNVVTGVA